MKKEKMYCVTFRRRGRREKERPLLKGKASV